MLVWVMTPRIHGKRNRCGPFGLGGINRVPPTQSKADCTITAVIKRTAKSNGFGAGRRSVTAPTSPIADVSTQKPTFDIPSASLRRALSRCWAVIGCSLSGVLRASGVEGGGMLGCDNVLQTPRHAMNESCSVSGLWLA